MENGLDYNELIVLLNEIKWTIKLKYNFDYQFVDIESKKILKVILDRFNDDIKHEYYFNSNNNNSKINVINFLNYLLKDNEEFKDRKHLPKE